jgi:hypothetical protein
VCHIHPRFALVLGAEHMKRILRVVHTRRSINARTNRKSNITKYRFVIDKKAKKLTRWILFEKGTNTQIAFVLNKYTPNPVIKEGMFAYDKSDFPGAKLIDLR